MDFSGILEKTAHVPGWYGYFSSVVSEMTRLQEKYSWRVQIWALSGSRDVEISSDIPQILQSYPRGGERYATSPKKRGEVVTFNGDDWVVVLNESRSGTPSYPARNCFVIARLTKPGELPREPDRARDYVERLYRAERAPWAKGVE